MESEMPRINPATSLNTPEKSKPMLEGFAKQFGMVPTLIQTLAHSSAGLKFYLSQVEALSAGELSAQLREQIALVTAGINHCDYCASVHTLAGKRRGLSSEELAANLAGSSQDEKVQVALNFAKEIVTKNGNVSDEAMECIRGGGYSESEIVEIIAHVGMNIFTNYFNHIARTTIDFPLVQTIRH
jgi:uncharacterized peroxidase-related enzyme